MAPDFGSPSGHIGMTTYTANLSLALILLAIFKANSIGIRLSAPVHTVKANNFRIVGVKWKSTGQL